MLKRELERQLAVTVRERDEALGDYQRLKRDVGELLRRLPIDLPAQANNMRLIVIADLNPF